MENESENNLSFKDKLQNILENNKKKITVIFIILVLVIGGVTYNNYSQNLKHSEISEKYVIAGIYLTQNKKEESRKTYKEIVLSNNNFYSPLALNNLIDNNLEKNETEILKLFEIIEKLKVDKEQKNLFKIKKALYLISISKKDEGNKLLEEIISENSVWKNVAIEIKE
tara:strand:- start:2 stop:508 length:507 start_codon:yes stop_codon:yes gene_type:complete